MEHILTRWIRVLVGSSAIAASVYPLMSQTAPVKATAKPAANETVTSVVLPATPSSLLPEALDGWVRDSAPKVLADPSQADPASAAALKEYDFTGAASATYKRDDETLNIHVLRFQDATGAYGAYSFYRQNGWLKEDIGAGATSFHNRVLFWKGDTVVDATFSHIGTRQPCARSSRNPLADASRPFSFAESLARRANHPLCNWTHRVRRWRRRAAGEPCWL